jgi:hypothetical protein
MTLTNNRRDVVGLHREPVAYASRLTLRGTHQGMLSTVTSRPAYLHSGEQSYYEAGAGGRTRSSYRGIPEKVLTVDSSRNSPSCPQGRVQTIYSSLLWIKDGSHQAAVV